MKLEKLLKPLKFNYVNSDITDKNFPYKEMLKGEVKVFHFEKSLTAKEVEELMGKENYRVATIHEMLAYAKDNWNGKELWVALGSVWVHSDGGRRVPCLYGHGSGRHLDLRWGNPGRRWYEDGRFVGVSKSSSQSLDALPLNSSSGVLDPSVAGRLDSLEKQMEKIKKILTF